MTKANTFALGVPVTIAGEPRRLRINNAALLECGATLKAKGFAGSVRAAVFGPDLDATVVFIVGAAGLLHEDSKITARSLAREVDTDPSSYIDLHNAVIEAVFLAYEAMGVLQRPTKDGAVGESTTKTSTSGAPASDTPPDSESRGQQSGS